MESEAILHAVESILLGISRPLPNCMKAFYVNEALQLGPEPFLESMGRLAARTGRLPCLNDIQADLGIEDDTPGKLPSRLNAAALLSEVDVAVRRYGAYRHAEAKASLSAVAWKLCASLGGWESVCGKTDWTLAMEKSYQLRLAEVLIREEAMTKRLEERKDRDETITLDSATSHTANAPALSEPVNSSYNEGRSHGRMR